MRDHKHSPDKDKIDDDLIYGRHTVMAAINGGRTLHRIWVVPSLRYSADFLPLINIAKENGAVIDEVDYKRLNQLTNHAKHQGIAAQVSSYPYLPLEEFVALVQERSSHPLVIIADGINDPHNLGAIIRSGEALGAQGLIIPQRRAVGVTSAVAKVAAGALEYLPICRVVNLTRAIEVLKEKGFWIYGTVLEGAKPIYTVPLTGAIGLVIGSEGEGISLLVQKHCDGLVSIPLEGKTASLNASVAAGIALYEISRQRSADRLKVQNPG